MMTSKIDLLTALLTNSRRSHQARRDEYRRDGKFQHAMHVNGWLAGIDEALAYIVGLTELADDADPQIRICSVCGSKLGREGRKIAGSDFCSVDCFFNAVAGGIR